MKEDSQTVVKGLSRWRRGIARALLLACVLAGMALGTLANAQIAFRAASQANSAAGQPVPTFRSFVATLAAAASGGADPTVTLPAHAANDILLLATMVRSNTATVATPAGWTQIGTPTVRSTVATYQFFWKRAASGAETNPLIDRTGTTGDVYAAVIVYQGAIATGDPWEVKGPVVTGTTDPSVITGITTLTANSLVVVAVAGEDNNNGAITTTGTDPAAYTEHYIESGTGADGVVTFSEFVRTTAGPTGNVSVNWDTAVPIGFGGIVLALRPLGSALTINVPAGTTTGDVMIASVTVRPCSNAALPCTVTVAAHADWGLPVDVQQQPAGGGTGGNGNQLFVYSRVVTGTEPASYTWTFGGAPVHAGAAGGIMSFSGVDTANPIVDQLGALTASSTSHAAPSINTGAVANTMLVSTHTSNSSTLWTPQASMTERVDVASLPVPDALGLALETNHELFAGPGATLTRTSTYFVGPPAPPAADAGITHMLALRPGAPVHHYAIGALSTSVANCDFAEVTITAHNAAHATVNAPAARIVTLSTSVGTGVWQLALVTGTGTWAPSGLNNGSATYQWPGGESSFTVRLRQSAVTALSVNLSDGFVAETPAEDPTISFVNSALRISNGANAALAIGNQIASKPSNTGVGTQSLFLQAIRTDTVTGACVSLFPTGSEIDIQVGAQCNNPVTCTQNVTLTTQSGTGSPTGTFVPNGAFPATIRFRFTTAAAEAPFFFSYADAGQITLQFRAALPSPPAGVFVSGTSNALVTRPFGFAFRGANAATAIQHGTLPTSALLAAAGDNFTMTVAAYRWAALEDDGTGNPLPGADITDNGLTPNFAFATTVSATGSLPGIATGAVSRGVGCAGAATIAAGSWSGGAATIGDWCYSEAGNVFLAATSNNYISAGVSITGNGGLDGSGAAGGYVGRFKPKFFVVTGAPTLTNRSALACASIFTYMNEGLLLAFSLEARNTQNVLTQNYTGAYAKLDLTTAASLGIGARSGGTNLTARVDSSTAPTGSFTNGAASLTVTTGIRRALPDAPDGPYTATQFGIAPNDNDPNPAGGVQMGTFNQDVDGNAVNDHAVVGGTTELRFGRLVVRNANGSQLVPLPVRVEAQYWSGAPTNAFITNTQDSCTAIAAANVAMGNFTSNLSGAPTCETAISGGGTLSSGRRTLLLAAPGSGNNGSVDLTVNLGALPAGNTCTALGGAPVSATTANLPYLQGNWTGGTYTVNPFARATFGVASGAEEVIFIRENY